jgi:hypothetical protein
MVKLHLLINIFEVIPMEKDAPTWVVLCKGGCVEYVVVKDEQCLAMLD